MLLAALPKSRPVVLVDFTEKASSTIGSGRSPRRNGIAERWVGSVRRDLLDHVIVLNQRHLRRLLQEYVRYYDQDRTHLGLGKETPDCRSAISLLSDRKIISIPRLGGLHHRYTVAA